MGLAGWCMAREENLRKAGLQEDRDQHVPASVCTAPGRMSRRGSPAFCFLCMSPQPSLKKIWKRGRGCYGHARWSLKSGEAWLIVSTSSVNALESKKKKKIAELCWVMYSWVSHYANLLWWAVLCVTLPKLWSPVIQSNANWVLLWR